MQSNNHGRGVRRGIMAALALATMAAGGAQADEVNVYSYRQEFLIRPFLDAYTEKTGTKVNVVYTQKGMVERLQREGENTLADAVLTVDIARLKEHADAGTLQPIQSEVLKQNIPEHFRDPDGEWFGLSTRVRILAVSKERAPEGAVKNYEDLADPKWKGKVCARPGSHPYNRALIASLIAHHGEKKAEEIVKGIVANFARKPQGGDRDQAKAVAEGVCDVAIMNHYYYVHMEMNEKEPEQQAVAKAVRVVFPNQDNRGAHANISGGGVTKYAKNKDAAVKLLEFLSGEEAQLMYANTNYEFPVNPKVQPNEAVIALGKFKTDTLPLAKIGDLSDEAQKLADRVGW